MDDSMRALEHTPKITLPDPRVAVCGDWHGNVRWLSSLAITIGRLAPDITTILRAGDWWMDLGASDRILKDAGIERVLVTLGNHEPWPHITPVLDTYPGEAVPVSERTWLLPRPYRFRIGGRQLLPMGGAASVDRACRDAGTDWWPGEASTDGHFESALAGGPADVMITHESPANTPVRAVRELLRTNPFGFSAEALVESAASRARIIQVWDAVRPDLLLHGHMHVPGGGTTTDGRRVISLRVDEQQGHLAFLDLATLTIETPSLRQIRDASARGEHTRHLDSRWTSPAQPGQSSCASRRPPDPSHPAREDGRLLRDNGVTEANEAAQGRLAAIRALRAIRPGQSPRITGRRNGGP